MLIEVDYPFSYPFLSLSVSIVPPIPDTPFWSRSISIMALLLLLWVFFGPGNCNPVGHFRTPLLTDDGDFDILADIVMALASAAGAGIAPRFQVVHLDGFDDSLFAFAKREVGDRIRGWGASTSPVEFIISNLHVLSFCRIPISYI